MSVRHRARRGERATRPQPGEGHGKDPVVSVTDMMEHIVMEGNRLYKNSAFEGTWVIAHDALVTMVGLGISSTKP